MTSKKPARAAAPKVVQGLKVTLTNRQKTAPQVQRKKSKKSTISRYEARQAKRAAWAKANPTMEPGKLGEQAKPKVAFPVVETLAQAATVMASGSGVGIDEKKVEQAQEVAQTAAEERAKADADA